MLTAKTSNGEAILAIFKLLVHRHHVWVSDWHGSYDQTNYNQHRLTTIPKVTSGSTLETADFEDALYRSITTAARTKPVVLRRLKPLRWLKTPSTMPTCPVDGRL
jgi:hypothetical protein